MCSGRVTSSPYMPAHGFIADRPRSADRCDAGRLLDAFFFFFLMPQPAAAFFLWWLAGSRIIETSLGLVPVTGVPSAAQRCLSCATVSCMSDSRWRDSSAPLICCGVIRCDMIAVGVEDALAYCAREETVGRHAQPCDVQRM